MKCKTNPQTNSDTRYFKDYAITKTTNQYLTLKMALQSEQKNIETIKRISSDKNKKNKQKKKFKNTYKTYEDYQQK